MPRPISPFALVLGFFLASFNTGCGNGESGEGGAPPYPGIGEGGEVRGERRFAARTTGLRQGRVRRMPWAGYWFPYTAGGISAAASKYESALGRSGAVAWERSRHGEGVPGVQGWWGHCNGWAAAAVLYPEPRSSRVAGGVEFGVGDQKALLSEIAMEVRATFFGRRYDGGGARSEAYRDVHPNQFLLVLTNYVGRGLPIVIDRHTGSQVWNHPVAGYRLKPFEESDYLGPAPGQPEVHRVNVEMTVWWVRDDVPQGKLTDEFGFEDGDSFESRTLRAELWLDGPPRTGRVLLARDGDAVLGGAWRNGPTESPNSHPDYVWVVDSLQRSTGYSNPELDPTWITSRFAK